MVAFTSASYAYLDRRRRDAFAQREGLCTQAHARQQSNTDQQMSFRNR
jgi:hypothetical protein